MQASKYTLGKVDLTDIYRSFHSNSRMHFFLKCTWNILQDRSCIGCMREGREGEKEEILYLNSLYLKLVEYAVQLGSATTLAKGISPE